MNDTTTQIEMILKDFEDVVADTEDDDFRLRRKRQLAAFLAERGFVPHAQDASADSGDNNATPPQSGVSS